MTVMFWSFKVNYVVSVYVFKFITLKGHQEIRVLNQSQCHIMQFWIKPSGSTTYMLKLHQVLMKVGLILKTILP